jgi:hypothetical protein
MHLLVNPTTLAQNLNRGVPSIVTDCDPLRIGSDKRLKRFRRRIMKAGIVHCE